MPHSVRRRKTKNIDTSKAKKAPRRRLMSLDLTMKQWVRFFSIASILLAVLLTIAGITAYDHYKVYPGRVERDTVLVRERGAGNIRIGWEATHNTEIYRVFYKVNDPDAPEDQKNGGEKGNEVDESWSLFETTEPEANIEGLEEDTSYSFIVRADNAKKEGIATEVRNFSTKKDQTIEVPSKKITKFSFSEPFKLNVVAETGLEYESSDTDVAEILPESGKIKLNGEGVTTITIRAKETSEFDAAQKKVELRVIETEPVSAGGASAHTIYHLDANNCEVVKTITGAGGAVVPQGLGYSGSKYIVSYGMGNPNRIISFDVDGDGKDVSVPKIALGHPNGFTYADENGLCYCVKGWSSKAVTYEPTSGKYSSVTLPYGCSGIGYDRKEKLLYTCSRTVMAAYDISDGYSVKYKTGVVKHSGHTYTQDCGGHAGIMLRCLSGSSKHGINYIDLYDMKNGRYLGTFSCDLSEVESAIVNKDGFLEILANNTSGTDYIWRTEINIESLGEGL